MKFNNRPPEFADALNLQITSCTAALEAGIKGLYLPPFGFVFGKGGRAFGMTQALVSGLAGS